MSKKMSDGFDPLSDRDMDQVSDGFDPLSDSDMDQVSGGSWDQPLTGCDLFGSMIKQLGYEGTKNTFYRHHLDQFYG